MINPLNLSKKWPKFVPALSEERQLINDDFVHFWHEVLPRKYGIVDRFNHNYVVKNAPNNFRRTLEIGAGNGEHIKYELLTIAQESQYYALDIRRNMVDEIRNKFPNIKTIIGDCQEKCKTVLTAANLHFLPEIVFPSASEMSALSYEKFINNDFEDVAYFEPFYLKDFLITK
jgi:hypothetical protein